MSTYDRCACGADLSTYPDPEGDDGYYVTECDTPLGCGAYSRVADYYDAAAADALA